MDALVLATATVGLGLLGVAGYAIWTIASLGRRP